MKKKCWHVHAGIGHRGARCDECHSRARWRAFQSLPPGHDPIRDPVAITPGHPESLVIGIRGCVTGTIVLLMAVDASH